MRSHFRDITDHARRVVDRLEVSRDLLDAAFEAYYTMLVARQGAVTQRLTVISTIFLPLTFVTGFFGQNFTWMVEQVDKGYGPSNVDIDAQYLAFKNGQNSITWDGIWQINDLEAAGLDYGIAPIPTRPGQSSNSAGSRPISALAPACSGGCSVAARKSAASICGAVSAAASRC